MQGLDLTPFDFLTYITEGKDATLGAVLQNRSELRALAEWMAKKEIRSYLEIGFFTGALMTALHEVFRFEKVAGCDEGLVHQRRGLAVTLPEKAQICWARSQGAEYQRFRHELGHIDLVFIDGDHAYGSVRQDYERERRRPHRFLAFHDIANDLRAPGVVRFWRELGGKKKEIVEPGSGMGIGIWSQKEAP